VLGGGIFVSEQDAERVAASSGAAAD